MSNELLLNATLAYSDSESADVALQVAQLAVTVASKRYTYQKVSVATSEQAVGLGGLGSLGWGLFINRDLTNFIELRVATAGTKFARLKAGNGFAFFFFGSGVTAPFAVADTAACQMEYLIASL